MHDDCTLLDLQAFQRYEQRHCGLGILARVARNGVDCTGSLVPGGCALVVVIVFLGCYLLQVLRRRRDLNKFVV